MVQPTIQQAYDHALRLHQSGALREAQRLYQQILAQQPDHVGALHYLGVLAHQQGRHAAAADLISQAITLNPNLPEAHNNLGLALQQMGKPDQAIASYERAIDLRPNYPQAFFNLGISLQNTGKLAEAIAAYRQAIAQRPTYAQAFCNLGIALRERGKLDKAHAAFAQAIALSPGYAEAHGNLGLVLKQQGQPDQAVASFRQAIALDPALADPHNNLGNLLCDIGQVDEAIAAYRNAITINPAFRKAHSNLVFTLNYHPDYDPGSIAQELRAWARQHGDPLRQSIQPPSNDRNPHRRLRIGYVSPDFRDHPVCRFALPLLANHDHSRFEIFCYGSVNHPDAITREVQQCANAWRDIARVPDSTVAQTIRDDQIDILVDLAGHTAENRLPIFATKPAPVQVTYLGFPASTGLDTIDYRFTDALADPPGLTDSYCTETLIRLPTTAWCYQPPQGAPRVDVLPCISSGRITFGSFNNFAKVTKPMLACWSQILRRVPGSRLFIKALGLHSERARSQLFQTMRDLGIAPERLDIRGPVPAGDHLALYGSMDIALDTYPYHGTTTSCEALWMGVPVITLAGQSHVSRVGVSLLSNVRLPELIAQTSDQYIQIATELAQELPRLIDIRSSLRERMSKSPLMDGPRFARNIEAAYRQMWRNWCATAPLSDHHE